MQRFVLAVFKIALACLMAGAVLSFFGVTTQSLLALLGTTPERLQEIARDAAAWAIPTMALGAIFVVPIWLVIFIFLPSRD